MTSSCGFTKNRRQAKGRARAGLFAQTIVAIMGLQLAAFSEAGRALQQQIGKPGTGKTSEDQAKQLFRQVQSGPDVIGPLRSPTMYPSGNMVAYADIDRPASDDLNKLKASIANGLPRAVTDIYAAADPDSLSLSGNDSVVIAFLTGFIEHNNAVTTQANDIPGPYYRRAPAPAAATTVDGLAQQVAEILVSVVQSDTHSIIPENNPKDLPPPVAVVDNAIIGAIQQGIQVSSEPDSGYVKLFNQLNVDPLQSAPDIAGGLVAVDNGAQPPSALEPDNPYGNFEESSALYALVAAAVEVDRTGSIAGN